MCLPDVFYRQKLKLSHDRCESENQSLPKPQVCPTVCSTNNKPVLCSVESSYSNCGWFGTPPACTDAACPVGYVSVCMLPTTSRSCPLTDFLFSPGCSRRRFYDMYRQASAKLLLSTLRERAVPACPGELCHPSWSRLRFGRAACLLHCRLRRQHWPLRPERPRRWLYRSFGRRRRERLSIR
jgi:hypothetical protein